MRQCNSAEGDSMYSGSWWHKFHRVTYVQITPCRMCLEGGVKMRPLVSSLRILERRPRPPWGLLSLRPGVVRGAPLDLRNSTEETLGARWFMRSPLKLIECVSAARDLENPRNEQRVARVPFFISKKCSVIQEACGDLCLGFKTGTQ